MTCVNEWGSRITYVISYELCQWQKVVDYICNPQPFLIYTVHPRSGHGHLHYIGLNHPLLLCQGKSRCQGKLLLKLTDGLVIKWHNVHVITKHNSKTHSAWYTFTDKLEERFFFKRNVTKRYLCSSKPSALYHCDVDITINTFWP